MRIRQTAINSIFAAALTAAAAPSYGTNDTPPRPTPQPVSVTGGAATAAGGNAVSGARAGASVGDVTGGGATIGDGALSPSSAAGATLTDQSQTNIDASQHNKVKVGAATNMNAASVHAVKTCMPSSAWSGALGAVFVGYASISYSNVASEALALNFKKDGQSHFYTIPEFAAKTSAQRAEIVDGSDPALTNEEKARLSCLTGEFLKTKQTLDASLNGAVKLQEQRDKTAIILRQMEKDGAEIVARINAARDLARIMQEHNCGHNAKRGIPLTIARGDTAKGRKTVDKNNHGVDEHNHCQAVGDRAVDFIFGGPAPGR